MVVDGAGDDAGYHVFDVAGLQAAMGTQLSVTVLNEALELADRSARRPVTKSDAASAPAGSPVVEGGRLIGVVADDLPEQKEFTEADMARGEPTSGGKRGLWKRIPAAATDRSKSADRTGDGSWDLGPARRADGE